MRALRVSLAVFVLSSVLGCSKGVDTVIPSDMTTWEKELAPVVSKLTDEERGLFASYVMRAKMSSALTNGAVDIPFGTTIAQAISEERKRVEQDAAELAEKKKKANEARALKEQLQAKRSEIEKSMREYVTVTLVAKSGVPGNPSAGRFGDQQRFVIGVANKSTQAISGVSGELQFIDLFGKQVGAVGFSIAERMEPGGVVEWIGTRDYNRFIDSHRAVWDLEEGQYTTLFQPAAIVFANGLKLEMPKD